MPGTSLGWCKCQHERPIPDLGLRDENKLLHLLAWWESEVTLYYSSTVVAQLHFKLDTRYFLYPVLLMETSGTPSPVLLELLVWVWFKKSKICSISVHMVGPYCSDLLNWNREQHTFHERSDGVVTSVRQGRSMQHGWNSQVVCLKYREVYWITYVIWFAFVCLF